MKKIFNQFYENSDFKNIISNTRFQIILYSLIVFIIVNITMSMRIFTFPYDYEVGQVVQEDIVITKDYIDLGATEKLKDRVKYEEDKVYTIDYTIYSTSKSNISDFFKKSHDIRLEYDEDTLVKIFTYFLKDEFRLTYDELSQLAGLDEIELRLTESYIYDVLKEVFAYGIRAEDVISKKKSVDDYFSDLDQLNENSKSIGTKIVSYSIRENKFIDQDETNIVIETKISQIEDVVIPAGTIILKAGKVADNKTIDIINLLNINNKHNLIQKMPMLNMSFSVFLILIIMGFVLFVRYNKNKYILMNFTIFIVGYILSYLFLDISVYILPVVSVAMLISILEDGYAGIIFSFFLAIILSVVYSISTEVVIIMLLGSLISTIFVHKAYQRSKIFIAGLIVSAINIMFITTFSFISNVPFVVAIQDISYGGLAGVLCSIITIGSLPLWELIFKIITPLKLLELASPSHPMMKRMLLEVPGTYHHSILVGNLSEAAAHDIGGNSLLARVGAYFHDIGKINKPFLYVENQYDGKNPHDQLVPRVSAKIIIGHIESGIKLGREYKLPDEILEFIQEHHGTTMVSYFYYKAKEDSVREVDREAYTYNGPIPSNKEIGIVMLADGVEAAVRSLTVHNKEAIKELVDKIFDSKIKSNQLMNSNLTLGDLEIIKKSFISNLTSAYHDRIEYPELEEQEK